MTRLKMTGWTLSVALALVAPLTMAQAQTKIAVVNVPRLLQEAPQTKSTMQALADEFAPRQRELVAAGEDLKKKQERLQRDGAVMAENERRAAEQEVREAQRELARKDSELREDAARRRNEELEKLQNSLMQEVQTYARSQNFDVVLGDGVLYFNDALDITPQILSALQARAKNTTAAPKPATPAPR